MKTTIFLLFASSVGFSQAFINDVFGAFVPKKQLPEITESFTDHELDIQLEIGDKDKFSIQNVVLALKNAKNNAKNFIHMPGANGPHPKISSGISDLSVKSPGHWIGLGGKNNPKFDPNSAGWELVWRDEQPAGYLVCGMELLEDASRNAAKLGKGKLYMNFPVWTKDRLDEFRLHKIRTEETSRQYRIERDEELEAYKNSKNVFAKAIHLRNAFQAVENLSLQPTSTMARVPNESDVIEIRPDLFLSKFGTVWTDKRDFLLPKAVHLGAATIKPAAPVTP